MRAQQLTFPELELARRTGHAAAQAAADRADRNAPGWVDDAVAALRCFARHQVAVFTIEQARGVIETQPGITEPTDKRAWGHVTRRAEAEGYIERVRGGYAPATSSSGSPKPLYRRGRAA